VATVPAAHRRPARPDADSTILIARFHPILVTCDNTNGMLATSQRLATPGGTAADNLDMMADAIAQLPAEHRRRFGRLVDHRGRTLGHGVDAGASPPGVREKSEVAEQTGLTGWPDRMRIIVRREWPIPAPNLVVRGTRRLRYTAPPSCAKITGNRQHPDTAPSLQHPTEHSQMSMTVVEPFGRRPRTVRREHQRGSRA